MKTSSPLAARGNLVCTIIASMRTWFFGNRLSSSSRFLFVRFCSNLWRSPCSRLRRGRPFPGSVCRRTTQHPSPWTSLARWPANSVRATACPSPLRRTARDCSACSSGWRATQRRRGCGWSPPRRGAESSGSWQLQQDAGGKVSAFVARAMFELPSIPPHLQNCRFAAGEFAWDLDGRPGCKLLLQASTDLKHWVTLHSCQLSNAPLGFVDPECHLYPNASTGSWPPRGWR